ncbi:MAG: BamA/TamA family outer membrane protein [Bacteroidales bacterium]
MIRILTILSLEILMFLVTVVHAQEQYLISDDRLVVVGFEVSGNKVTQERIITREMVFGVGDTLLKMELIPVLQLCKVNLLNTSLFNFVFLDVSHLPGNRIIIEIRVTERWYIWPVPIIEYSERNFSEFIKNWEWDRLVYGAWLKWSNFRGRNELLTGKVKLGYINEYALGYEMPNLGMKQQHGISLGFNVNHQNEVNVRTVNNQPVEINPVENPAQIRGNAFAKYHFRRKFYSTHTLRMDYYYYDITDMVANINPNYLGGGMASTNFFTLYYEFRYDLRDSKVYPLEGFLVKLSAKQTGLGIIPSFPYSFTSLTGALMYHHKLANRLYFYNTYKGRVTTEKKLPHILNQGLGYDEWLSAYEPYVLDGSDYFISKFNLKVQLVKPKSKTIPLVKMEQFNQIHYAVYLNGFVDVGYVNNEFPDPTNTMLNTLQFSAGAGIDLVTYYDQVFRIDFAINRYGEHGFFFHLETPFYRW